MLCNQKGGGGGGGGGGGEGRLAIRLKARMNLLDNHNLWMNHKSWNTHVFAYQTYSSVNLDRKFGNLEKILSPLYWFHFTIFHTIKWFDLTMSTKVDRNYTNVRNMRKSFESEEKFCPMAPHGKANSEQFEIIKLEMFKIAPMAPRKGGWGRNSWMSIPICFLFSNNKSLGILFSIWAKNVTNLTKKYL